MATLNYQGEQAAANYLFNERKVFNDPIHGQIEIHPVCVRIIDTPQFQRLRRIKQLDACDLVYPGACHTRFEHSIGTCYLAEKLMRTLQQRQPSENIDERDILCVMIAALCHDLGQGPFSHVFEKIFMPEMKKPFTHEGTARKMFEYILEDNDKIVQKDIQDIIRECKIQGFDEFREEDFLFIKELIDKPKDLNAEVWPYAGRDESKSFMYEIVANKRNGIDVDKWDYLLRDSYMLGMKVNFQYERCIVSARIFRGNGNDSDDSGGNLDDSGGNSESDDSRMRRTVTRKQICYREKNAIDLYDMFYARMTLHRRAYQHKTHRIIGIMITEALKKANDTLRFQGETRTYSIADAVDDMKAFTQLTDDIFQTILYTTPGSIELHSSDVEEVDRSAHPQVVSASNCASGAEEKQKNFIEAKKILNDILNRRLLKYVTGTQTKGESIDEEVFKNEFLRTIMVEENTWIDYDVVSLDYGMKNKNPMENVRFYRKESDRYSMKLKRNQISYVLPDTFAENSLTIFCENVRQDSVALFARIKERFWSWCEEKGLPFPKGPRQLSQNTSPKQLQTSESDTEQKREIQESDLGQLSEEENLENKRLVEPNTVSPNEEHQDGESLSTIGGVDIRPQDTLVSEDENCS